MSEHHTEADPTTGAHWSVAPRTVNWIVRGLYALCAASVLLDLVIHRHEKLGFAGAFGFYALYGFVACVGLVIAAKALRRVLLRPEDYYAEDPD